jgi:hypothetical protein
VEVTDNNKHLLIYDTHSITTVKKFTVKALEVNFIQPFGED